MFASPISGRKPSKMECYSSVKIRKSKADDLEEKKYKVTLDTPGTMPVKGMRKTASQQEGFKTIEQKEEEF